MKSGVFNTSSRRFLLAIIVGFSLFHVGTLSQIPPLSPNEVWYVSPAYTHYKSGTFDDTMFPGLIEFQNGPFGQGKLRYLLQSYSFKFLGFGPYQARFPMLLGGLLAAYVVYLTGCYLFGIDAGLYAAVLYILCPVFYHAHEGGSHSWLAACFVLAAYFFLRLLSERRPIFAFAAGLTVGISVNFHLTGVLGIIPLTALLFYNRFKKEVDNTHVLCYLLGGLVAFVLYGLLEIGPIGLDAFMKKSAYGVRVAESGGYIGDRWVNYFLRGGRGIIVELPLILSVIGSFKLFWQESRTRSFYLFFLGLLTAYTLFTGSGSHITVWAALFVLVGGLTSILFHERVPLRPLLQRAWAGLLVLVVLYDANIQAKAAYSASRIRAEDQYAALTSNLTNHIPEGKTIMGSPLFWFGFVGRNPYITQNFYWERMDMQTHELGVEGQQPVSVRTQRMISFLKRRDVEYLIADEYFQQALKPWIPEDQWGKVFTVLAEFQSPIYGAPSGGGQPPYKIQIWRMAEGGAL